VRFDFQKFLYQTELPLECLRIVRLSIMLGKGLDTLKVFTLQLNDLGLPVRSCDKITDYGNPPRPA